MSQLQQKNQLPDSGIRLTLTGGYSQDGYTLAMPNLRLGNRLPLFVNRHKLTLYIKNMVCPRCIAAVEQAFEDQQIKPLYVRLGEVSLEGPLSPLQHESLTSRLEELGFELLDDIRSRQIEKIKSLIIEQIHHKEEEKVSFSALLSNSLHREYSQLSKLFSETEGITIEHFAILQKIEKVKELLVYNEMSLSEIAFRLGYSSVAHLSAQFKKMTGLTPSQFKGQGIHLRKPIDGVQRN